MSNYLKPQSPLQIGSDFVYPLTTADQVILNDGTRLNSSVVLADLNNADSESVYDPDTFVDADTFGGLSADKYATKDYVAAQIAELNDKDDDIDLSGFMLKTDTAVNSNKLGGVEANQYILKTGLNELIKDVDLSPAQIADWDGMTLPAEIPNGLSYTQAGTDAIEKGFPANYITCFAIRHNVDRCIQIAAVKGSAIAYIRTPQSNSVDGWVEWKRIITFGDKVTEAVNAEKLGNVDANNYALKTNVIMIDPIDQTNHSDEGHMPMIVDGKWEKISLDSLATQILAKLPTWTGGSY